MRATGFVALVVVCLLAARVEADPEDGGAEGEVIEVVVEGKNTEPAKVVLDDDETRNLPGALGDPFRAIEILPGVTPTVSGLPFFFVRGSPPGNVGYYLDGVRVPYLFHALGGPSVIHPKLIEQVSLHQGGYPARFGRYAGAIVDATTVEPRADWHGEGQVRLIDAGAFVEGGFADGRGTVLAAGRYSYTAAIFSAISPDVTLDYRDFQARVTYDLTERDRLSLLAFGSYDYYAQATPHGDDPAFATEFYRVDARYDVRLERGGRLRLALTTGYDDSTLMDGRQAQSTMLGSRALLYQPLSQAFALEVGFDVEHDVYGIEPPPYFDPDDPVNVGYNELFRGRNDAAASTWLSITWRPLPEVAFTPGVRLDGYASAGEKAIGVDPRLQTTLALSNDLRVLSALGLAHQRPSYIVPVPGLSPAQLEDGLQTAIQSSAGIEIDLPWSTMATVSVFHNVFLDMTDALSEAPAFALPHEVPRTQGSGKGLELYLRRSLARRIGGFLSYTFSRTTRSHGASNEAAAFDRTHVLSMALGYDFGGGWRGGTRLSYHSGAPLFIRGAGNLGGGHMPARDEQGEVIRDPGFYRLDVRFEKKWALTERAWLALVLEVVNATLKSEVVHGGRLIPVTLPSIGLEGGL
jgi:hypothetical protein